MQRGAQLNVRRLLWGPLFFRGTKSYTESTEVEAQRSTERKEKGLTPAVVPEDAFVAGHDRAAGGPDRFPEEAQVGAVAVEVDLAGGRDEALFSDDGEAQVARPGEFCSDRSPHWRKVRG